MNVQLLIDSLVRQMTVLIAQLATSGGVHAPLAHVANQVFVDLATELERQGLVFCSGQGADAVYRAVSAEELSVLRESGQQRGLAEFVWAHVYRHGPLSGERLAAVVGLEAPLLDEVLRELTHAGRVERDDRTAEPVYRAARLVIGLDDPRGFEASMYDHFQALVSTLCRKLDPELARSEYAPHVGGSTYTFDVGPEHPLRDEVLATLHEFRSRCSDLRTRVKDLNGQPGAAPPCERVIAYAGQSVSWDEADSAKESNHA